MKRLLGAIGFAGAMLFAVGSANAALIGSFSLSPGTPTYNGGIFVNGGLDSGGTARSISNSTPIWWEIDVNSFGLPVNLEVDTSTQNKSFGGTLNAMLCAAIDGSGNCTGAPLASGTGQSTNLLTFNLVPTTYFLTYKGTPLNSQTWGFSFTATASTPIPAGALLFVSGLAALGLTSKKRKARQEVASN